MSTSFRSVDQYTHNSVHSIYCATISIKLLIKWINLLDKTIVCNHDSAYICVLFQLIFGSVTNITACIHIFLFCFGISKKWSTFYSCVRDPCHRKLKLQRFDFFCKEACSSYLWSSTWDKDSPISAQLAEDYSPEVKACNSLTVLSRFPQVLNILNVVTECTVFTESKLTHTKHTLVWSAQGPLSVALMMRDTVTLMFPLEFSQI